MTDQDPYAGYDKGQLYDVLVKAGGEPTRVPHPEAFRDAWKTAPDPKPHIEEKNGKRYQVDEHGVGVEILPDEGSMEEAIADIKASQEAMERDTIQRLAYADQRNIKRLDYAAIADYILHKYNCVAFNKTVYIYNPDTGTYQVDKAEIGHEVKKIATAVDYKGGLSNAIAEVTVYILTSGPPNRDWPFNCVDGVIPVRNGVVKIDFETQTITLAPHSPDYRLTYTLNVNYDPNADGSWFHENVISAYVDEEDVDLLYQIPGQALLQMQKGAEKPYKKSYILKGDANAGKTTYLEILKRVFGGDNCSSVSLHQIGSDEFANASMENSLLNIADDLSDIPLKNVAPFKALTGSFSHRIEQKFKPAYQGRISCVHCYTCNATPGVSEKITYDAAFWERWEYIHFQNVFEIDTDFNDRVLTDDNMSGFFNEVLKYVIRIRREGLVINHDPGEVKTAWQLASDPFKQFLSTHMQACKDERKYDKENLLGIFRDYCKNSEVSERKIPCTVTAFTTMIFKDGFRSGRVRVKGTKERRMMYMAFYEFKPESKYYDRGAKTTGQEDLEEFF